jgi:hypothetical protein
MFVRCACCRVLWAFLLLLISSTAALELKHYPAVQHDSQKTPTRKNAPAITIEPKRGHIRRSQSALQLGQAPTTTVSDSGYGERLTESLLHFVAGIVLIVFSVPVLWFNEKRVAEMEALLKQGANDCLSVGGQQADPTNDGCLIHITDEKAEAGAPMRDDRFQEVFFEKGCLRLNRKVEIYQWVEAKTERSEDQLGGGRRTVTTYSYHKEWGASFHESRNFNQPSSHANTKPDWLEPGVKLTNCDHVNYGDAFVLPEGLVSQCHNFVEAKLPPKLTATASAGGHIFDKKGEYYYYSQDKKGQEPKVGDIRVHFTCVPDGVMTVIALQDHGKEKRASFLPYRAISLGLLGGIFGISKEEEVMRRFAEGRKSADELRRQATWTTWPFSCLCCACNLVAGCMQSLMTPEIYHLYAGSVTLADCFEKMENANQCGKWIGRFVGWIMMYIGLCGVFAPFVAVLAVIPFLSHLGGWVVGVFSFLVTLILASVISAAAWFAYRPLVAAATLAVAWAVFVTLSMITAAK